jgi:tRNA threonylcarbamoyladenosine biosynthesis protein TsaE
MQVQWLSSSVEQTQAIAAQIARVCYQACADRGVLITLEGQLGAGKTAFSQGFIQSLLPSARVRSPTFSLIESYQLATCSVHHLDLYRLQDAEELEYLGLRDLFWHNICLIEWASKGEGWLPEADLELVLTLDGDNRQIVCIANTENGIRLLEQVKPLL